MTDDYVKKISNVKPDVKFKAKVRYTYLILKTPQNPKVKLDIILFTMTRGKNDC